MRILRLLAALFAVLTFGTSPALADEQMLLLGVGGPHGGTPPVSLSAIHFTGAYYVKSTTLGPTDTPYGVLSYWQNLGEGSDANFTVNSASGIIADWITNVSPDGCTPTCGSESIAGVNIANDQTGGHMGTLRLDFSDATPGNGHTIDFIGQTAGQYLPYNGGWVHTVMAWNFSTAGTPYFAIYTNGVATPYTLSGTYSLPTGSFSPNIANNANGFSIFGNAGNGHPSAGDMAQVFLDNGASIVCTSTSNITVNSVSYACPGGANTIPPILLAKFYNGGPVDFGSTGSNPLGAQPLVLLNGTAAGGFLTNKGSSTATFAPTQTMTANVSGGHTVAAQFGGTPAIWDAFSGPGSSASGIQRKWVAYAFGAPTFDNPTTGAMGLLTSSSTSLVMTSQGYPIKTGDLIMVACMINDNSSAIARNFSLSSPPSGWTFTSLLPAYSWPSSGTDGFYQSGIVVYGFAPHDYPAPSAGTSNDISLTFSYAAGSGGKTQSCTMIDYGGVTTVTASSPTNSYSSAATWTAPSMTPTASSSVFGSMFFNWQAQQAQTIVPAQTSSRLEFLLPNAEQGQPSEVIVIDEPITGTTATGTRSLTTAGSNHSYQSFSYLLQ